MKSLEQFIIEKLKIQNNTVKRTKTELTLFPKSKVELKKMIETEIDKNGNECSLNHIDVSEITDMSGLFKESIFNGDISEWDVSNVKNMECMFFLSYFTGEKGNIGEWDVSNVTNMLEMFRDCPFNGNISEWDVSNVTDMSGMFAESEFTGENSDISKWDVSSVKEMYCMFYISKFNGDISSWKINKNTNTSNMFDKSPLQNKKEFWPKRK